MKIFLESHILKEKRDFLKENEIVFEILTIVKKAIKILEDYKIHVYDDTYDPYEEALFQTYSVNKNARVSIHNNKITIQIIKLKSFDIFNKIFVVYYISDYNKPIGDYNIQFKEYFEKLEYPNISFHIGIPDEFDNREIISLLDLIVSNTSTETLIHEIEHMLQDYRTKYKKYSYHEPDENRDKYFNQTSEIEANIASILRQKTKELYNKIKNTLKINKVSPSEMREFLQNYPEFSLKIFQDKNMKIIGGIPEYFEISNKKVIKRFLNFAKKEIKRAYIQTIQSFIK